MKHMSKREKEKNHKQEQQTNPDQAFSSGPRSRTRLYTSRTNSRVGKHDRQRVPREQEAEKHQHQQHCHGAAPGGGHRSKPASEDTTQACEKLKSADPKQMVKVATGLRKRPGRHLARHHGCAARTTCPGNWQQQTLRSIDTDPELTTLPSGHRKIQVDQIDSKKEREIAKRNMGVLSPPNQGLHS